MIYMVTATITSLWSILLQHLLRPYDPYCYSNYYVFMTYIVTSTYHAFLNYIVTATTTPLWSIWLQQLSHLYDPYCYSNYYVLMIYIVTAYYILMITIPGERPPCTHSRDWGPPPDAPYQERPGGRHAKHPRICLLCYHIVFFPVLPFVLFDICRTEDHKPRGRASDVSTISTRVSLYFQWFTAHSPTQTLWERAGGITVVYLCGF